jgi:hypothetical protein
MDGGAGHDVDSYHSHGMYMLGHWCSCSNGLGLGLKG